jgi:hypothetical protein
VVVIGNFDVNQGSIVPAFNHTGKWYEFFTGDSLDVTSLTASIELAAGEYRLYTDKRLAKPETGLGVTEPTTFNENIWDPYPNPASAVINFPVSALQPTQASIEIYDLMGRYIGTAYSGKLFRGENILTVHPEKHNLRKNGMYLLVVKTEKQTKSFRILIE